MPRATNGIGGVSTVQNGGLPEGRRRVRGSVTAASLAAAQDWAVQQRVLLGVDADGNGYRLPEEMETDYEFVPRTDGVATVVGGQAGEINVRLWGVSFTFGEAGAMSEPRYLLFWRAPEQALELVRHLGSKGDRRSRLLGFGVPLSAFDEEKQLPTRIHTAVATARAHDLAVMLSFDLHIPWRSRPDLWNWFDTDQAGYQAANRRTVEWFGWDGSPAKTRDLNWGVVERIAPPPCLTSVAYRSEVMRLVREVGGGLRTGAVTGRQTYPCNT